RSAADCQLADTAAGKAAADDQAFRLLPSFELEESLRHRRQLVGKILDRALHNARGLAFAGGQKFVELFLGDRFLVLAGKRIPPDLAQRLAPFLDEIAERALAGAVADEAVSILNREVIALDLDRRQACAAMRRKHGADHCLLGHRYLSRTRDNGG